MPKSTNERFKSQVVPLTGTDARKAIREKVARALCKEAGEDPDDRGLAGAPNWSWFLEPADAAIADHLEALEQMELPEEVSRVGRETLLTHGRTLDDAFRAICAALRSPKTGGESHE